MEISPLPPTFSTKRGQVVDLAAAEGGAAGGAEGAHHAALGQRLAEHRELGVAQQVRKVRQLHGVAYVRLVGAEAAHGLVVGEAREGLDLAQVGPDVRRQRREQLLHQLQHVLFVDEAHLEVELGELRLAVGAQVLVAEAAGDLEVALEAGHHQQLLELLRRLGQGVEAARVDAAGHQVVARALGRALDQDGRLHLQEALLGQEVADELHHPVAEPDVALHPLPPQVQVAIAQPQEVFHLRLLVDVEGRRLGGVEDGGGGRLHLHLAGGQVAVLGARPAAHHLALHLDHVLGAHLVGGGIGLLGLLRVEHHLGDAVAVAQVDEDQRAVVAAAVHPARQAHLLALVLGAQLAAAVGLI